MVPPPRPTIACGVSPPSSAAGGLPAEGDARAKVSEHRNSHHRDHQPEQHGPDRGCAFLGDNPYCSQHDRWQEKEQSRLHRLAGKEPPGGTRSNGHDDEPEALGQRELHDSSPKSECRRDETAVQGREATRCAPATTRRPDLMMLLCLSRRDFGRRRIVWGRTGMSHSNGSRAGSYQAIVTCSPTRRGVDRAAGRQIIRKPTSVGDSRLESQARHSNDLRPAAGSCRPRGRCSA